MAPSETIQAVARPSHAAPKTMSSNLMTMKFMQRAAASQSQRSKPVQSFPDALEPPSKRRKPDTRTPNYGRAEESARSLATPLSDIQLIQAATTDEEAKKESAIERLAAEAGDTKWVLSTTERDEVGGDRGLEMRITKAGYGEIDEVDGGLDGGGRRSFKKFNDAIERDPNGTADHLSQTSLPSESSSDEQGNVDVDEDGIEDNDDPTGTRDLIRAAQREVAEHSRAERKAKRKAELKAGNQTLARLVQKSKPKEVKLNKLSSISGGGALSGSGGRRDMSNIECYQCGGKGHERRDCPQKAARQSRDGASRDGKKSGDLLDHENR